MNAGGFNCLVRVGKVLGGRGGKRTGRVQAADGIFFGKLEPQSFGVVVDDFRTL